jgi:hypothetical protein
MQFEKLSSLHLILQIFIAFGVNGNFSFTKSVLNTKKGLRVLPGFAAAWCKRPTKRIVARARSKVLGSKAIILLRRGRSLE